MLNILFACFLFGMLIARCIRVFRRAAAEKAGMTVQELAFMIALAIGSLIALNAGSMAVYHTLPETF